MAKIHVSNGFVPTNVASTARYMKEVKKAKPQDWHALITKAQAGDLKARNQVIEGNLRFVIQVAKQYQGMGVAFEDLVAFGNIGLFEALERFDVSKKVKFLTFATNMVNDIVKNKRRLVKSSIVATIHLTPQEKGGHLMSPSLLLSA